MLLISAYILVFYVRKLNQPRFHLLMFSLISLASIMLVIVGVLLLTGDRITLAAREKYNALGRFDEAGR